MVLSYVCLAVAISFASVSLGKFLRPRGSLRLLAVIKGTGRIFSLVSFMALGALLHDLWLRKPAEAVVVVVVTLLMTIIGQFDKRRAA